MRISCLLLLSALVLLVPRFAHANFPAPPSQAECKALVERAATEAAGQSSAATRQRIERYILEIGSPQPQLQNHAGVALLIQGYPYEAIWCMAKALNTNFDQPEVLNNIGLALTLLKKYNQAERILLYVTHEWPKFSGAWVNLARLYLDQGNDRRAEEAVARSRKAEPGNLPAEEAAARIAIQRRDRRAAAKQAVTISSLDPGNPWVAPLTEVAGDSNIEREIGDRLRSVPMPRYYVSLDRPINSDYEALVWEELNSPFWGPASQRFFGQAFNFKRQRTQLTPEITAQLSPEVKAALKRVQRESLTPPTGGRKGVLAPSVSRAGYLFLGKRLDAYSERYRGHLMRILKEGPLARFVQDEFQRQLQFIKEYGEDKKRGDPRSAANRYVRRSLDSLNSKHSQFLELARQARRQQNNHLRRFWMSTTALLSLVPDEHRRVEIHYLRQQAAMTNEYYLAQVVSWIEMGKQPIQLDQMLAETAPEMLHTAAADRALQDLIAREEAERDWEEELEDDRALFSVTPWRGLNAGAFSFKVTDNQVGITIGEALQGDVSFNWEDFEVEMAIGPGISTPSAGPISAGFSGKVQLVFSIGGHTGAAIEIRQQVQASRGTPIHGEDLTLYEHTTTLVSAGAPRR
jgi:tetratricopeptide (TPR) repeat protein